jgi:hypothetical protein
LIPSKEVSLMSALVAPKTGVAQTSSPQPGRIPDRELVWRRTLAVLAAVSGVLHFAVIGHVPALVGALMVAMIIACLPCAGHLWRTQSTKSLVLVTGMSSAMLVMHAALMMSGYSDEGGGVRELAAGHHASHTTSAGPLRSLVQNDGLLYFATAAALMEVIGASLLLINRRKAQ